ncbi:protein VAC14 homolog [Pistacia vera]|uniref:protein VAC14 homolog n=1 Tax=Pistacia vera TaxID=55513 RepID=UPI001262B0A6|nr:protein VAC14 homolog [Pistacia vera]
MWRIDRIAAATVGLTLKRLSILSNRFNGNELYRLIDVVRGDFIIFFNQIFDALCKLSADSDANVQSAAHLLDRLVKDIVTESDQFSIEEFIPLLRERMNVLNPYVRQFLVGWITVLDSVPDIDMLGFLPDFLDVLLLKSVDYGRMAEILVQRAASPDEFTRLTAITWINEFVKLGGDQLVPYYADILGAILPCISDKEEKIRVVARETNEELRAIQAEPAEGFDVGAILSIARRQLSSEWEATRIEALHWISTLLNRHRAEVLIYLNEIFDTLLKALSDPSDEVVLLVIEVHACIAKDPQHFRQLVVFLVHNFRIDNSLLEKRGALIIRRLCVLLDAKRVYLELSTILEGESDLDFACIMVQALNLILLTSSELSELRDLLKQSLVNPAGKELFVSLYASWCHSPMAIISLCLLAQTYQHVSTVIQSLVEEDINVKFLVQLDKLIRLLETPTFAYLRLQLLEPGRYTWLLKALYGLLMLLPQQSAAFKILRTRLKTIPSYSFNGEQFKRTSSGNPYSLPTGSQFSEDGDLNSDMGTSHSGINFNSRLQQFEQMQHQHRMHVKAQVQLRNSSTTVSKEVQRPQEPHQLSPSSDGSRPSSRSSKKGPGQLQL